MTPSEKDAAVKRRVRWFGCGAASAVAIKLDLSKHSDGVVAYCETNAEHEDNERFLKDCERWWNFPVTRLKSDEYHDTWDVWEKRRYIAGNDGAPCTGLLKVTPRMEFQRPDDIHVFGYTCDANDQQRAKKLVATYFEMTIENPLIEAGLTHSACQAILERAGIKLPVMYGFGFDHNNCIPCPKATSPNYWAAMRQHFPQQFARMVELSRRLDVRLTRIHDERIFIDEIPADWPTLNPTAPSCDFLCHIAEQGLSR